MLKRIISAVVISAILAGFPVFSKGLEQSDLSAKAAVLYYPEGNIVLFEKNQDMQLSMASTTKIMTSLIALEENTPLREITVTHEMVNVEGTSSGLKAEDVITLENLVKCMMLESGNDAANAVAITLGGSFDDFAVMMNNRAEEIGMKNTSFMTPSGLDHENHYTTAYDMALLSAEAIKNKQFAAVSATASDTISFVNSNKTVTLYNHNRLINSYNGCIGIKTGFTKKSGRCLVSAATRDGVTLIAVTLNAGDDWNDHEKMLDYGFSVVTSSAADTDFSSFCVRVAGGEKDTVIPVADSTNLNMINENTDRVYRRVYLNKILFAPVEKGTVIGYAQYFSGDRIIKEIPLTASESIDAKSGETEQNIFHRLKSLFDSWWKNG